MAFGSNRELTLLALLLRHLEAINTLLELLIILVNGLKLRHLQVKMLPQWSYFSMIFSVATEQQML